MSFPDACIHGQRNSYIMKVRERKDEEIGRLCHSWKKSFRISCQNTTCFRQYRNLYHQIQQLVTDWCNSPAVSGCNMQQFLVCIQIIIFCYTDFCLLGIWTPKVLLRRQGGQNGFKKLLLNMGNSFGRERGRSSTLWALLPQQLWEITTQTRTCSE